MNEDTQDTFTEFSTTICAVLELLEDGPVPNADPRLLAIFNEVPLETLKKADIFGGLLNVILQHPNIVQSRKKLNLRKNIKVSSNKNESQTIQTLDSANSVSAFMFQSLKGDETTNNLRVVQSFGENSEPEILRKNSSDSERGVGNNSFSDFAINIGTPPYYGICKVPANTPESYSLISPINLVKDSRNFLVYKKDVCINDRAIVQKVKDKTSSESIGETDVKIERDLSRLTFCIDSKILSDNQLYNEDSSLYSTCSSSYNSSNSLLLSPNTKQHITISKSNDKGLHFCHDSSPKEILEGLDLEPDYALKLNLQTQLSFIPTGVLNFSKLEPEVLRLSKSLETLNCNCMFDHNRFSERNCKSLSSFSEVDDLVVSNTKNSKVFCKKYSICCLNHHKLVNIEENLNFKLNEDKKFYDYNCEHQVLKPQLPNKSFLAYKTVNNDKTFPSTCALEHTNSDAFNVNIQKKHIFIKDLPQDSSSISLNSNEPQVQLNNDPDMHLYVHDSLVSLERNDQQAPVEALDSNVQRAPLEGNDPPAHIESINLQAPPEGYNFQTLLEGNNFLTILEGNNSKTPLEGNYPQAPQERYCLPASLEDNDRQKSLKAYVLEASLEVNDMQAFLRSHDSPLPLEGHDLQEVPLKVHNSQASVEVHDSEALLEVNDLQDPVGVHVLQAAPEVHDLHASQALDLHASQVHDLHASQVLDLHASQVLDLHASQVLDLHASQVLDLHASQVLDLQASMDIIDQPPCLEVLDQPLSPEVQDLQASLEVHDPQASLQFHDLQASLEFHDLQASLEFHDLQASLEVHDRLASLEVHDRLASPEVHDRLASPEVHDLQASLEAYDSPGLAKVNDSPRLAKVNDSPRLIKVNDTPAAIKVNDSLAHLDVHGLDLYDLQVLPHGVNDSQAPLEINDTLAPLEIIDSQAPLESNDLGASLEVHDSLAPQNVFDLLQVSNAFHMTEPLEGYDSQAPLECNVLQVLRKSNGPQASTEDNDSQAPLKSVDPAEVLEDNDPQAPLNVYDSQTLPKIHILGITYEDQNLQALEVQDPQMFLDAHHVQKHIDAHDLQIHLDVHDLQTDQDVHDLQTHQDVHDLQTHQDVHDLQTHQDVHDLQTHQGVHDLQIYQDVPNLQTYHDFPKHLDVRDLQTYQDAHDLRTHLGVHVMQETVAFHDLPAYNDPQVPLKVYDSQAFPEIHILGTTYEDQDLQASEVQDPQIHLDAHDLQKHIDDHDLQIHLDAHDLQNHIDAHDFQIHVDVHDLQAHQDVHDLQTCQDVHDLQMYQNVHDLQTHQDVRNLQTRQDVRNLQTHQDVHDLQTHQEVHVMQGTVAFHDLPAHLKILDSPPIEICETQAPLYSQVLKASLKVNDSQASLKVYDQQAMHAIHDPQAILDIHTPQITLEVYYPQGILGCNDYKDPQGVNNLQMFNILPAPLEGNDLQTSLELNHLHALDENAARAPLCDNDSQTNLEGNKLHAHLQVHDSEIPQTPLKCQDLQPVDFNNLEAPLEVHDLQATLDVHNLQTHLEVHDSQVLLDAYDSQESLGLHNSQVYLEEPDLVGQVSQVYDLQTPQVHIPLKSLELQGLQPFLNVYDMQKTLTGHDHPALLKVLNLQASLEINDQPSTLKIQDLETPLKVHDSQATLDIINSQETHEVQNRHAVLGSNSCKAPQGDKYLQTLFIKLTVLQALLEGNDLQTPLGCNDLQTSLGGNDLQTPLCSIGLQTSLCGNDVQTSTCGNDLQIPLCGNDLQTPQSGNDLQTPQCGNDLQTLQTSICGNDLQTPQCGNDLQTPQCGNDLQTLQCGNDLQTPQCGNDLQTPQCGIDLQTPLDVNVLQPSLESNDDLQVIADSNDLQVHTDSNDLQAPQGGNFLQALLRGDFPPAHLESNDLATSLDCKDLQVLLSNEDYGPQVFLESYVKKAIKSKDPQLIEGSKHQTSIKVDGPQIGLSVKDNDMQIFLKGNDQQISIEGNDFQSSVNGNILETVVDSNNLQLSVEDIVTKTPAEGNDSKISVEGKDPQSSVEGNDLQFPLEGIVPKIFLVDDDSQITLKDNDPQIPLELKGSQLPVEANDHPGHIEFNNPVAHNVGNSNNIIQTQNFKLNAREVEEIISMDWNIEHNEALKQLANDYFLDFDSRKNCENVFNTTRRICRKVSHLINNHEVDIESEITLEKENHIPMFHQKSVHLSTIGNEVNKSQTNNEVGVSQINKEIIKDKCKRQAVILDCSMGTSNVDSIAKDLDGTLQSNSNVKDQFQTFCNDLKNFEMILGSPLSNTNELVATIKSENKFSCCLDNEDTHRRNEILLYNLKTENSIDLFNECRLTLKAIQERFDCISNIFKSDGQKQVLSLLKQKVKHFNNNTNMEDILKLEITNLKKQLENKELALLEQRQVCFKQSKELGIYEKYKQTRMANYAKLHSDLTSLIAARENLHMEYKTLQIEFNKAKHVYEAKDRFLNTWLKEDSIPNKSLDLNPRKLQLDLVFAEANFKALSIEYHENKRLMNGLRDQIFELLIDILPYDEYFSVEYFEKHFWGLWNIGDLSPLYCKCPHDECNCLNETTKHLSERVARKRENLFKNVHVHRDCEGNPMNSSSYHPRFIEKSKFVSRSNGLLSNIKNQPLKTIIPPLSKIEFASYNDNNNSTADSPVCVELEKCQLIDGETDIQLERSVNESSINPYPDNSQSPTLQLCEKSLESYGDLEDKNDFRRLSPSLDKGCIERFVNKHIQKNFNIPICSQKSNIQQNKSIPIDSNKSQANLLDKDLMDNFNFVDKNDPRPLIPKLDKGGIEKLVRNYIKPDLKIPVSNKFFQEGLKSSSSVLSTAPPSMLKEVKSGKLYCDPNHSFKNITKMIKSHLKSNYQESTSKVTDTSLPTTVENNNKNYLKDLPEVKNNYINCSLTATNRFLREINEFSCSYDQESKVIRDLTAKSELKSHQKTTESIQFKGENVGENGFSKDLAKVNKNFSALSLSKNNRFLRAGNISSNDMVEVNTNLSTFSLNANNRFLRDLDISYNPQTQVSSKCELNANNESNFEITETISPKEENIEKIASINKNFANLSLISTNKYLREANEIDCSYNAKTKIASVLNAKTESNYPYSTSKVTDTIPLNEEITGMNYLKDFEEINNNYCDKFLKATNEFLIEKDEIYCSDDPLTNGTSELKAETNPIGEINPLEVVQNQIPPAVDLFPLKACETVSSKALQDNSVNEATTPKPKTIIKVISEDIENPSVVQKLYKHELQSNSNSGNNQDSTTGQVQPFSLHKLAINFRRNYQVQNSEVDSPSTNIIIYPKVMQTDSLIMERGISSGASDKLEINNLEFKKNFQKEMEQKCYELERKERKPTVIANSLQPATSSSSTVTETMMLPHIDILKENLAFGTGSRVQVAPMASMGSKYLVKFKIVVMMIIAVIRFKAIRKSNFMNCDTDYQRLEKINCMESVNSSKPGFWKIDSALRIYANTGERLVNNDPIFKSKIDKSLNINTQLNTHAWAIENQHSTEHDKKGKLQMKEINNDNSKLNKSPLEQNESQLSFNDLSTPFCDVSAPNMGSLKEKVKQKQNLKLNSTVKKDQMDKKDLLSSERQAIKIKTEKMVLPHDEEKTNWKQVTPKRPVSRSKSESRTISIEQARKRSRSESEKAKPSDCEVAILSIPSNISRKSLMKAVTVFGKVKVLTFYPDVGYSHQRAYVLFEDSDSCSKALQEKVLIIGKAKLPIMDISALEWRNVVLRPDKNKDNEKVCDSEGIKCSESSEKVLNSWEEVDSSKNVESDQIMFDYRKKNSPVGGVKHPPSLSNVMFLVPDVNSAAPLSGVGRGTRKDTPWPEKTRPLGERPSRQDLEEVSSSICFSPDILDTDSDVTFVPTSKKLKKLVYFLNGIFPAIPIPELVQSIDDIRERHNYTLSGVHFSELAREVYQDRLDKTGATECQCCLLCTDLYVISDSTVLICLHSFHKKCLEGWIQIIKECPICGLPIQELTEH